MAKTTLILVRHAESEYNVENRVSGSGSDSGLTEKGKWQAELLGKSLARESIDAVYSSPQGRALKTAAIAKPDGAEINTMKGLTELDFGEIEGMKWDDVDARLPGFRARYMATGELQGLREAEGFLEGQERIYGTVKKLADRDAGRSILIFTHGTILRLLLARIMGLSRDGAMKITIRNCAINTLTYDNENRKFNVEKMNDDGFLN